MPESFAADGLLIARRRDVVPAGRPAAGQRAGGSGSRLVWIGVAVASVAAAVAWVLLTQMRPSYDSFGWLVWGREVLHGSLNTDGAPSWKPLTFLFTLPYALAGTNAQMYLWIVTASVATIAGAICAGRIAARLTLRASDARAGWAAAVAALFAGVGVLGLDGYSHLVLIANSDPMVVALGLGAIDAWLCRRRRLAFVLLVLMSLGRPEAWPFTLLYGAWLARAEADARWLVGAGLVLIPLSWFLVPGLTSHSPFSAGDLALGQATVIHGNKIVGVLQRLRGLYSIPMQLAVLLSAVLALARRDRVWLGLLGCAALWVAVEIAFAYHGWSAVARYLLEPGAVLVTLAGAAVGLLLSRRPVVLTVIGLLVVVALAGSLTPTARGRLRVTHGEIDDSHRYARELTRLQAVVAQVGGRAAILACGQPVTLLGTQSEVAWVVGLNVGDVGFHPGRAIGKGEPVVEIKPHDQGWQLRPFNIPAARRARCESLRTDSNMGP